LFDVTALQSHFLFSSRISIYTMQSSLTEAEWDDVVERKYDIPLPEQQSVGGAVLTPTPTSVPSAEISAASASSSQ
jgi:hypothetical protein